MSASLPPAIVPTKLPTPIGFSPHDHKHISSQTHSHVRKEKERETYGETETNKKVTSAVEGLEGVGDGDLDEKNSRHAHGGHDGDPQDVPLTEQFERCEEAQFRTASFSVDRLGLSVQRHQKQNHCDQREDRKPDLPSQVL